MRDVFQSGRFTEAHLDGVIRAYDVFETGFYVKLYTRYKSHRK